MSAHAPLLALLALAQGPASPASAQLPLIDMVVAQVDATVITLSELVAETRLVLLRTAGPEVARAGKLGQGLLDSVLRGVVSRELVLGEVRRLGLEDVDAQDVERELGHLRQRFPAPADWERFLDRAGFRGLAEDPEREGGPPRALAEILRSELVVDRFLAARLARRIAAPKESELLRCFELNRAALEGRSLEEVRGLIAERIVAERRRAAVEGLLATLAAKSTVRYAPGFEPSAAKPSLETLGLRCPSDDEPRRQP